MPKRKKHNSKTWYALQGFLSLAWLIATTIGGNMLNNISPTLAFLLFVLSLCALLSYWTWILTGRISNWQPFSSRVARFVSVFLVIGATIVASPYYIEYFITNQDSIEMPEFVNDSDKIKVHYGNKIDEFMWAQKSIGELKQESLTAFSINGQDIFYVHIEGNKLYVDTLLFAGIHDQSRHMFSPPVMIKNNAFSRKPEGWKIEQSNTALEITNEKNIPVFILKYESPYEITVWGLFVTRMGILKVDNTEGTVFLLGDTLSELGTYTVDRIFIHSIFDLFKPERTYVLSD